MTPMPDATAEDRPDALVIGGGPAGLMAADALLSAGHTVLLAEAKPTLGRKFLMAGKSGLNLTKAEKAEAFLQAYGPATADLAPMLAAFPPEAVMAWAEGLGQPVFTGSTGRVFPEAMKASPLLRAWRQRLDGLGLQTRTRWRWTGWEDSVGAATSVADGTMPVATASVTATATPVANNTTPVADAARSDANGTTPLANADTPLADGTTPVANDATSVANAATSDPNAAPPEGNRAVPAQHPDTSPEASVTFHFDTPDGPRKVTPRVAILALGGASWARLGSDGLWAPLLARAGIIVTPFAPANAGLSVSWSAHMAPHHGAPLKNMAFTAGALTARGEAVITARGLEGGGLYPLSPALRDGAALTIDLAPDRETEDLARRLAAQRGKQSLTNRLRKGWGLSAAALALLNECPLPQEPARLAALAKALPVPHAGLRPLDEAISTAGGVSLKEIDEGLMLTRMPGVFCCGEMLDWEAPTGGYLLTACLATGLWAGRHAARRLSG